MPTIFFVERLWNSVKYEKMYLHVYDSVNQARKSIMHYLDRYNRSRRPHSKLNKKHLMRHMSMKKNEQRHLALTDGIRNKGR